MENTAAVPMTVRQPEKLMRRATLAAVAAAASLIIAKTAAWGLSGSVAVLGSLFDSLIDLAASAVNLLAVRHALTPADREHRFGHGKAEALAGLGQAGLIIVSAGIIAVEAIDSLVEPQPLRYGATAIAVMVFSSIVTLALVTFQHHVIRQTKSLAIRADSLHYRSDLIMNLAVIAAIVLAAGLGVHAADPLLGLVIAVFIAWSAWQIVAQSFDHLMDRELSDDDRNKIKQIVLRHPDVSGIHDLRTRDSGTRRFIQFHIELPPDMRLLAAHEICDRVEESVRRAFPGSDVLIHQDPAGHETISGLETV